MLSRWLLGAPFATWLNPILRVRHSAFLFLPIHYLFRGLALIDPSEIAGFWLHAITIGVIGGMTLAMMTRTARGDTGRGLRDSKIETLAQLLLISCVVSRLLLPMFALGPYYNSVLLSAALWMGAFSLYVWVFIPWLLTPLVDNTAGQREASISVMHSCQRHCHHRCYRR